jgi:hypothetical protein
MVSYLVKIQFKGRGQLFPVGKKLTAEDVKEWMNLDKMVSSGYLEKLIQEDDADTDADVGNDMVGRAIKKRNLKKKTASKKKITAIVPVASGET